MEGTLRVTPQKLISTAQEFSSAGSNVASLTQAMTDVVNSLSSIWQGESATMYVSRFNELNDDIQKMIAMVNEHSTDLTDMANNYISNTNSNAELIESLSGDVIV